jgi:high frequency lysogenization protein
MHHTEAERALALAGLLQACRLVQQVAHGRPRDTQALETSIGSIFKLDADSTLEVYGSLDGLRMGLELVVEQLEGRASKPDLELSRYAIAILHLERKLGQHPELLQKIKTGVELALSQADYFSLVHTNVIASLAETYQQTVSTLRPRIMVNGDQNQLNNPDNANWIRALLLAAIRSAVLWRQAGGSRWKLLLGRRKLAVAARRWLEQERGPLH